MKRIVLAAAAALVLLLLVFWLWPSWGDEEVGAQFDEVAIDRGDITRIVSAVGSVRAVNTVEVGSQLSGQIEALHADFNTRVRAGDLLAELDPQTFERRVQEAEANLAVARAGVEVQKATIRKAEANLANARRELERQARLVERGSVSESDLDLAETTYLLAEADLEIARSQLLTAEATVLQREASLEAARIDLERTEIHSPIDGVVIERAVDVGQTVAAGLQTPLLFNIARDLGEIRIEASVDEADIGSVREGAAVRFTVDAFPDRDFTGDVSQVRLAPEEEQNVVTYTVVINAENPEQRLLPGMTASIDIETGKREDVLRVDNAAIRFRPPDEAVADAAEAPSPGGGGPGEQMADGLREMGVDDATIERIQADYQEAFGRMRGLFMSGADREVIRERMEAITREVLGQHLDAAQLEAWTERMRQFENTRAAQLYTVTGDGRVRAHPVRLGISDDKFTEVVVAGELKVGDQVVSRMRRTGPDA